MVKKEYAFTIADFITCNHADFRGALLSIYAAFRSLNRDYYPRSEASTLLSLLSGGNALGSATLGGSTLG